MQVGGWTDFKKLLVTSDGSHSIGTPTNPTRRDSGSKIVFFDTDAGNNTTGEAYFWDGENIIDTRGSATNTNGTAYGTDPFQPNLNAIKPLRNVNGSLSQDELDPRVRVSYHDFGQMAGGFPDWFLFRRGQSHREFTLTFEGGRSQEQPMLVGGYGPKSDGRAIIDPITSSTNPELRHPLYSSRNGQTPLYQHIVLTGLDIVDGWRSTGLNDPEAVNPNGEPVSGYVEDCSFTKGGGVRIVHPPRHLVVRRSVVGYSWTGDDHTQGYYTDGFVAETTMDEVIFYKNGYKTDPRRNADPKRDVFSRNIYAGGGAKMGHTYRNIISADGASGGPQMRMGGLMESSLVIEGYWFSATDSNSPVNKWPGNQDGQSAVVRNNVQLVFQYPSVADPDPGNLSSNIAQPGAGYKAGAATFNAQIESNIISGAMQVNDLKSPPPNAGLELAPAENTFLDGQNRNLKNVSFNQNIIYKMSTGFGLDNNWAGETGVPVTGVNIADNIFVSSSAYRTTNNGPQNTNQLLVQNNRFYLNNTLPNATWLGTGNLVNTMSTAATTEGWSDPERTLLRYVTEVLNLQPLDWDDDPYLDPAQAADRKSKQEVYDPTGLKTFMAVAMSMRNGGTVAIPTSGKPTIDADYPWDQRFTGKAVVNWIREGFGLPNVN